MILETGKMRMATVSYSSREIDCKLVYAGPGLSGKTTNVKFIHSQIPSSDRGKLISLATGNERTLFFDFLPINTGTIYGFKVRLHLYSVPGQAMYTDSRQLILQGVDGIIFVADSQRARMDANIASLRDLKENLRDTKRKGLSLVLQTNKRDLPDILPTDTIRKKLGLERVPCIESVAVDGTGVFETLRKASRIVMRRLHRQFSLALNEKRG
jgi:signal recognition particle receptor subunit beta